MYMCLHGIAEAYTCTKALASKYSDAGHILELVGMVLNSETSFGLLEEKNVESAC